MEEEQRKRDYERLQGLEASQAERLQIPAAAGADRLTYPAKGVSAAAAASE